MQSIKKLAYLSTNLLLTLSVTGNVYAADPGVGPSSQPSGQSGVWYSQSIDVSKDQTFEVTYDSTKKLKIFIPSSTFAEKVTVFANRIVKGGSAVPTGLKSASDNWDFRAERPSDSKEFKTFAKKVIINMPYNDVAGEEAIYFWDGKWNKLATTLKDGVATAQIDHFTEFAVLAGAATATTATPNVAGNTFNWVLASVLGLVGVLAFGFKLRKN